MVSQPLYSPAPSLSHSTGSDFQPPYFPPPYQPLPYTQPNDPYSHLSDPFNINSIHQSPTSNQQQPWPGRQNQDGIGPHARSGLATQILGLESGSSSVRRDAFRRPELLPPHVHGLESAMGENMGLHEMGQGLDDVQVSVPHPSAQNLLNRAIRPFFSMNYCLARTKLFNQRHTHSYYMRQRIF